MDGQNDNLNDPNVVAVPSPTGATSGLHDPNVVAVPPEGEPQGGGPAHTGPSSADIFQTNPNDPWYERAGKGLVNAGANALSGAGGGVIDTATGVLQGAPKMAPMGILANAVAPHAVGAVEDAVGKFKDQYGGVQDTGVSGMIGYGGESLLEFLASDGAMQGLSLGKKLEAVSGITKVLEQSPRTMGAVRLGALVGKILEHAGINTMQASTIAGLQTYLKSGGDFGKALTDFIHTAEFAGPFSAVAGAAGEAGSYLGRTAKSYQRLEQAVSTATPKEEVVKDMSQRLNAAEKQMHDEYQSGFEDIADRTQGQTVPSTHTPLAQAASEILANPKPDVNPFVASLERKVGETLDPKVKELLTELSTGVSADDAKAYEEAQRTASRPVNTGVVGANGQPITRAAEVPTAPTPHEYTGQELVQIRQTIRKLSESFDYGNINSRVLRSLISSYGDRVSPLDNTLGQLAGQTGTMILSMTT